jgi:hypothetical protein
MAKESKIRVHNRSKRSFTIPPAPGKQKDREIMPGRSADIEESTAEKYLKLYPVELIRYEALVAPGEDKEKEALKSENEALKAKLAELEGKSKEDDKPSQNNAQRAEGRSKGKTPGPGSLFSGKKE